VALLLALGTLTSAAIQALDLVVSSWLAPLLVAAGWVLVAALLVRDHHPRQLLHRLARDPGDETMAAALRERAEIEAELEVSAELLAAAFMRETIEREVATEVGAVESEVEVLLRELLAVLRMPARVSFGLVERLRARGNGTD
jgi:hypothetical protein